MPVSIDDRLRVAEGHLILARDQLADVRAALARVEAASPPAASPAPLEPPHWTGPPPPLPSAADGPSPGARAAGLLAVLQGPRLLAWAGGATTLLGIALLFVLGIHRGWIDEELRLALAGLASTALVAAGVLLRRRLGPAPAATVAAGVGLAGSFVTLAAAVALYELMPRWIGLTLAELVAAGAVALALAWRAQPVAAFGLVGAIACAPVMAGGVEPAGTAFAAAAFAAACGLMRHRRWTPTLLLATAGAVPQALVLVTLSDLHPLTAAGGAGAVAAGVVLASLRGAVEHQRRAGPGLAPPALTLALAGAAVAAAGATRLLPVDGGAALLVAAAPYLGWAGWLQAKGRARDLGSLIGAIGVAFLGAGLMVALDGVARIAALSAVGVAAIWLAGRLREPRLRWGAAVLGLLGGAAALVAAPPSVLATPAQVAWPAVAAAAALLAGLVAAVRLAPEPVVRRGAAWAALAVAAYAASLVVLRLADAALGDPAAAFQRGHAVTSALWVLAGLGGVVAWSRGGRRRFRDAGLLLLAAGLAKAFLFDLAQLEAMARAASFLAVGAALLAAGALVGWRRARRGEEPAPALAPGERS